MVFFFLFLKLSKRVAVLQEELDEYDGKNRRGKVDIICLA